MLRIRELREEAGLTQKQLATAINNMQRNVSNWEQGTSEPDIATVVALADFFDVSLDELFGRQEHVNSTDAELVRIVRSMSPERKAKLLAFLSDK